MPYTKLDDDLIKDFCKAIRAGLGLVSASRLVGISYRTMNRWLKRADELIENEENPYPTSKDALCVKLRIAMGKARSVRLNYLIKKAVEENPKGSINYILSKLYPDEFGSERAVVATLAQYDPQFADLSRMLEIANMFMDEEGNETPLLHFIKELRDTHEKQSTDDGDNEA